MKKSRYTEEQIAYVLRQAESGTPVSDVCRSIGISIMAYTVIQHNVQKTVPST